MDVSRRKKDFRFRNDLLREFESLAPSGRQTAIVESLLENWVREQKRAKEFAQMKDAYAREAKVKRR